MIITCKKKYLHQRCRERGRSIEEVAGCVVSSDGDMVTIDTEHPDYPRGETRPPATSDTPHEIASAGPGEAYTPPGEGPGTELKRLLSGWPFHIKASPNCSCNARALVMDENERRLPGWCEANIDQIVGWLREEATKRKLPFVDLAGRMLVRRAIRAAKNSKALMSGANPR